MTAIIGLFLWIVFVLLGGFFGKLSFMNVPLESPIERMAICAIIFPVVGIIFSIIGLVGRIFLAPISYLLGLG